MSQLSSLFAKVYVERELGECPVYFVYCMNLNLLQNVLSKEKVISLTTCYAGRLSPGIGQEQVPLMIGKVEYDALQMFEHPGRFERSHSPEV